MNLILVYSSELVKLYWSSFSSDCNYHQQHASKFLRSPLDLVKNLVFSWILSTMYSNIPVVLVNIIFSCQPETRLFKIFLPYLSFGQLGVAVAMMEALQALTKGSIRETSQQYNNKCEIKSFFFFLRFKFEPIVLKLILTTDLSYC
jgi:hypothetical protein